jgi:hypothetical protein
MNVLIVYFPTIELYYILAVDSFFAVQKDLCP